MILPVFNAIKTTLESHLNELQTLQFYNNNQTRQGTILKTPAVWVAFSDLDLETIGQSHQKAPCEVTVYLVTNLLSKKDGHIDTDKISLHEDLDAKIYRHLQGLASEDDPKRFGPLNRIRYTLEISNDNLLIAKHTFSTLIYQENLKAYQKRTVKLDIKH